MPMRLRFLTLLACGLPLMAAAAVPVQDGSGGYASAPPSGYGTAGAEGAYAGGGMTTPVSGQAQLFMQLQQMQDELSRLRGMLEEQQNQIQQMKQENLERYQDLDSRISGGAGAGSASAAQQNSPVAGASAGVAAGAGAAAATQQPAASSEPGDPAKEKLYYDAAFDLIKAKDFDKASQAFGAFLRKYPNSQYAGNAQYWLGEVNLAKGDLQGAGQAFARVSQAYPSSAKVPDSLYKLADVERRLGNTDKARGILQQVIAQYPGSSAAQLSQRDLKNLK
ncbi:tol-pal system protein YbgF [Pseudomonas sp. ZM23]|uniref:Cell division coordinator CpoB n=1 Tax=Pseudomonas triclosanedens TaxID=2961893 RepID=A0ABY7A510_9PSED|nr:tol-pal system protein YbgF [Pseudomonas triclosanedens]MCP8464224.1 tol-pal system protein YbgF [Pseudomonas triclosanedens]MCP8471358.1 tol-pal system protein YbgF [Pseudomonas triclosanedens]MCP8477833.1 tol-pal system protein YbgF [Pseudomonas triclosanedens]WAI51280.1 tol-pal system protein YbgF [Pseudomonas triclosanedens]